MSFTKIYIFSVAAIGLSLLSLSSGAIAQTAVVAGSLTIIPAPSSLAQDQTQSDTTAVGFFEKKGYTLGSPLTVSAISPGLYDQNSDFPSVSPRLAGFWEVASFIIHADSITNAVGGGGRVFNGSVTFDMPILGIIVNGNRLVNSDAILGNPLVTYENSGIGRGMEFNPSGQDTLEWTGNTITFHFVEFPATLDEVRIVVFSVPEPGQISTLGSMAIAGGFFALRRRRAVKK